MLNKKLGKLEEKRKTASHQLEIMKCIIFSINIKLKKK